VSVLLIALTFTAAQSWEPLGVAPGATTYFDPASTVIIDATRRRVRIRAVYNQVKPNGAASSVALGEIDCVHRTATLLETQELDAAGTVIETRTIPPAQRRTTPPAPRGGPEEAGLFRMCGTPSE
jgi:hypothetical protein